MPGWVLITLMTAGLVIVIWGLAGPALERRVRPGDRAGCSASDALVTACRVATARASLSDERGSAVAEFTLVGILLTVLALAVVQLALALHVRNTLLDAAAEGARYAALAGSDERAGHRAHARPHRGSDLGRVRATTSPRDARRSAASPTVAVTVRATLPVIGLLGVDRGLEVTGHAAVETLE